MEERETWLLRVTTGQSRLLTFIKGNFVAWRWRKGKNGIKKYFGALMVKSSCCLNYCRRIVSK